MVTIFFEEIRSSIYLNKKRSMVHVNINSFLLWKDHVQNNFFFILTDAKVK